MYACCPQFWEMEAGRSGFQGQPLLLSKCETSLNYRKQCLKNFMSSSKELTLDPAGEAHSPLADLGASVQQSWSWSLVECFWSLFQMCIFQSEVY